MSAPVKGLYRHRATRSAQERVWRKARASAKRWPPEVLDRITDIDLLTARGLSIRGVAKACEVSTDTVYGWLRKGKDPGFTNGLKLARALMLDPYFLLVLLAGRAEVWGRRRASGG